MTTAGRVDSGDRSFLLLLGIVVGFRTTLMVLACCVVCVVGVRLLTTGPATLWARGGWMLPATMLAGLVIASTIAVVVRAAQALWAERALRRRLRRHAGDADGRVREIAARYRLDRLRVADDPAVFAFTYGFVMPTIVLSSALVRTLSADELAAVLAHESAHVRGRDPLKVLVARLVVSREFYLPALRHLSARFVGGRELAADRQAATSCGVRPLAGALLRVLDPPAWAAATPAAAMASAATLDARISQLESGAEPPLPAPPRGLTLVTLLLGVLVLAAAVESAVLVQQFCMRVM